MIFTLLMILARTIRSLVVFISRQLKPLSRLLLILKLSVLVRSLMIPLILFHSSVVIFKLTRRNIFSLLLQVLVTKFFTGLIFPLVIPFMVSCSALLFSKILGFLFRLLMMLLFQLLITVMVLLITPTNTFPLSKPISIFSMLFIM